jgi:hypothetical protein
MINVDNLALTRNRSLTTEGSIVKQLKVAGKAVGQVVFIPKPGYYTFSTGGITMCTVTKPAHATGMVIQCSFGQYGEYARFKIEERTLAGALVRTMPEALSMVNFLEYASTADVVDIGILAVTDYSYYSGYSITSNSAQNLQVTVSLF